MTLTLVDQIWDAVKDGSVTLQIRPTHFDKVQVTLTDVSLIGNGGFCGYSINCNQDTHGNLVPLTQDEDCEWHQQLIKQLDNNPQQH